MALRAGVGSCTRPMRVPEAQVGIRVAQILIPEGTGVPDERLRRLTLAPEGAEMRFTVADDGVVGADLGAIEVMAIGDRRVTNYQMNAGSRLPAREPRSALVAAGGHGDFSRSAPLRPAPRSRRSS